MLRTDRQCLQQVTTVILRNSDRLEYFDDNKDWMATLRLQSSEDWLQCARFEKLMGMGFDSKVELVHEDPSRNVISSQCQ